MRTLQGTLSHSLVFALLSLVIVVSAGGGYAIRHLVENFAASQVEHTLEALLAGMFFDEQGVPVVTGARITPVFEQPFSGHYYRIQSGGHRVRSRSLWDEDLMMGQGRSGQLTRSWTEGPDKQVLLVITGRFRKQGREVMISVAEDFSAVLGAIRSLQWMFAGFGLVVLTLALGVQRYLIRRGLAPLDRLREEVKSLQRGEATTVGVDAPEEVAPLVSEINRLTGLTVQRLQRSRNALGNMAHAVKTPLTVLTRLARHPDLADRPELRAELEKQTGLVRERIERELRRARIAGGPAPGQRVEIAPAVRDLVMTLEKIYRDKPLRIDSDIPAGLQFPGDRDDLLELLGNLMDNACKWARQQVRVSAHTGYAGLVLLVEDDGPGIPVETLGQLTSRGGRLDETRHGHGLGLAIVGDIVDQYAGIIRFTRSGSLGGLRVEVIFKQVTG